jgi:hypothetical protein
MVWIGSRTAGKRAGTRSAALSAALVLSDAIAAEAPIASPLTLLRVAFGLEVARATTKALSLPMFAARVANSAAILRAEAMALATFWRVSGLCYRCLLAHMV